ncbi:hypothetical protein D3C79_796070 [compost metagenome]
MRLGRAQAEQAAPDDRLAQFVSQLHLHQAHVHSMAKFVLEGLVQQQSDAFAPPAFVPFLRGQGLGTAQLIMGWRPHCAGMAVGLGNQGRAAGGDQPHRGFEHLRETHIEPDAARHQLDYQRAADHDQQQLAKQRARPQPTEPAHLRHPPRCGRGSAGSLRCGW